ncbi:hypothetical protein BU16DRAFT_570799 [Lophium mytilinum]|uniref:Ecp2 effector protein domain-containing protein n=1 Tax=Lophium mytilinum TaxID=390894 RepID=A0A6A6R0E9_9PEZI|nr:hypothetical protein BU16DRAFT_570799 [Lophium mytilinum]
MLSQYIALATIAASSVYALPNIANRDNTGVWDPNGNIKLTFSHDTVKLGDVDINAMFDALTGACHESGQCDTSPLTFDGWWQASGLNGEMGPIVVTMDPSGAYPTWIRNGLVDTLRAAVLAAANCGNSVNTQGCGGDEKGCQLTKTTAWQCEIPKYVGINFQDPKAANAAPPNIGADITMELVDSDICAQILGGMGAVAGAVSGYAGGIFSLLSLACN